MSAGDQYFEDLLKIEFTYTGERNTAANIMYASCAAAHGATFDSLASLATTIGTLWVDNIMPLIHEAITLEYCYVSDWTDADGLTAGELEVQAGGLTGELLPDQVATLINLESLSRYRGGHGRIYIPAPEQAKIQTGTTWTSAFADDMTTAITAVLNGINDATISDDPLTSVLYHRAGAKIVEQGFEEITGAVCSLTPGTQRRRVRRVGHIA